MPDNKMTSKGLKRAVAKYDQKDLNEIISTTTDNEMKKAALEERLRKKMEASSKKYKYGGKVDNDINEANDMM